MVFFLHSKGLFCSYFACSLVIVSSLLHIERTSALSARVRRAFAKHSMRLERQCFQKRFPTQITYVAAGVVIVAALVKLCVADTARMAYGKALPTLPNVGISNALIGERTPADTTQRI